MRLRLLLLNAPLTVHILHITHDGCKQVHTPAQSHRCADASMREGAANSATETNSQAIAVRAASCMQVGRAICKWDGRYAELWTIGGSDRSLLRSLRPTVGRCGMLHAA